MGGFSPNFSRINTWGHEGQWRMHIKGVRTSGITGFECSWGCGLLRLCRRCRRKPSPPAITAGGSGFVVFVVTIPASHYHSGRALSHRKPSPPAITVGSCLVHRNTSCRPPNRSSTDVGFLGSPLPGPTTSTKKALHRKRKFAA